MLLVTGSARGTVLSSVDTAVNKKERIPVLTQATFVCMCVGALGIDTNQSNK